MPASAVCRWSIPRAPLARCHSRDCISAPTLIRTLSSSCSGKLRLSSACLLGRSGELAPGGPPLPNTMLGNSASDEVGKSYSRLIDQAHHHHILFRHSHAKLLVFCAHGLPFELPVKLHHFGKLCWREMDISFKLKPKR